jgi:hypothetical protein
VETQEEMVCTECGGDHYDCDRSLLLGMSITAHHNAKQMLSPAGREVYEMLMAASKELETIPTVNEMMTLNNISKEDQLALAVLVARMSLIEHTLEHLERGELLEGRRRIDEQGRNEGDHGRILWRLS